MFSASFYNNNIGFPSFSQEVQNVDNETLGSKLVFGNGVLPTTVHVIKELFKNNMLKNNQFLLFNKEYRFILLQGWIYSFSNDDTSKWTGSLIDCTDIVKFEYEHRTDLGDEYANWIETVRSDIKSNALKFIGTPQIIDEELIYIVSFIQNSSPINALCAHVFDCALIYLKNQTDSTNETCSVQSTLPSSSSMQELPEINIDDEELIDLLDDKYINKYLWKLVNDHDSDTVTINYLIQKSSNDFDSASITEAIKELEDNGVFLYVDNAKTTITPYKKYKV